MIDMDHKYDYVIKKIVNRRADGKVNQYHEKIIGQRCSVFDLSLNQKASLLIERFNTEELHYNRWYYTSCVIAVGTNDEDELIIETMNSTYVLAKLKESEV